MQFSSTATDDASIPKCKTIYIIEDADRPDGFFAPSREPEVCVTGARTPSPWLLIIGDYSKVHFPPPGMIRDSKS